MFHFVRVAIDIPTVEVRFEHLNVGAEAYVGKRALPSVTNLCLNILEVTFVDRLVGISALPAFHLQACYSSVLHFNIAIPLNRGY